MLGAACSTDPCAPNGRCVDGASCVGGKCTALGLALGSVCSSPYPNDPCPADLYCKGIHCLPPNTPFTGPICASPAAVGSGCDGDAPKTTLTDACQPCGVGLRCVGATAGALGKCHDTCKTDADCPCGSGQRCSTGLAVDPPAPDGTCFNCRAAAQECSAQNPCCDGTKCALAADSVVRCCKPKGDICIVNAECCQGSVCRLPDPAPPPLFAPGACGPCAVLGEACHATSECCAGSACIDGVCKKSCSAGAACSVPGAKGECAKGKVQCDAVGNSTCVGPNPVAESCNGKDDDCDGKVDNLPAEACTVTPSGCQAGFKATGQFACVGSSKVCKAATAYCGVGGVPCGGSTATGGYCGTCAATASCAGSGSVSLCVPNFACTSTGGGGPPQCLQNFDCTSTKVPNCWLPEDAGKCVP